MRRDLQSSRLEQRSSSRAIRTGRSPSPARDASQPGLLRGTGDEKMLSESTLAQAADALLSDQAVSLCDRVIGE